MPGKKAPPAPPPAPPPPRGSRRQFGPCPKCAGSDISVDWHEGGKPHCWLCDVPSCRFSTVCGEHGIEREHLTAFCRRCGFGWIEKVSP